MDTYLLLDPQDQAVNLVVWDGVEDYLIPPGTRLVRYSGRWGAAWKWDGVQCVDPNPPPPPSPPAAPPPSSAPSGIKTI